MTTQSGVTTQSEKTQAEATAPPGMTTPPEGTATPKNPTTIKPTTKTSARASQAGRRVGYVIAIIINLAFLYLINVMPGWTAIDVLTAEFTTVLWIINLSLLLSVAANVAYIAYDSTWFKASCEFTLAAISLIIAIRMYQVFPFDFATFAFNWTVLARLIIVAVMIGSLIAMVVNAVRLFLVVVSGPPPANT
jgi:hypothetical protein